MGKQLDTLDALDLSHALHRVKSSVSSWFLPHEAHRVTIERSVLRKLLLAHGQHINDPFMMGFLQHDNFYRDVHKEMTDVRSR